MAYIWNAFIVKMPAASPYIDAFFRMATLLETNPHWEQNTYGPDQFAPFEDASNNLYYLLSAVIDENNPVGQVVSLFKGGAPYSSPAFQSLRDGNQGNAGVTEAEFNGVRDAIEIQMAPNTDLITWAASKGLTIKIENDGTW